MNQQMIINMLLNKTGNNPIVNNAINMFRSGNTSGIETLAKNLCKSKGVNPEDALKNAQRMFGYK